MNPNSGGPASMALPVLQTRLQMHAVSTQSVMAGTMLAGLTVVWMLWLPVGSPVALLSWLAALLAAVLGRMGVRAWHLRDSAIPQAGARAPLSQMPACATHGSRHLLRYRLAFGLHGAVWAVLPLLVPQPWDAQALVMLSFVIACMVGASLVSTAFDARAALCFALPAALPLMLMLSVQQHPLARSLLIIGGLFTALMTFAAHRSARLTLASVRSSLALDERTAQAEKLAKEAESAGRALADQHALLQQLLRTTHQGFWFVDTQGRTLDVNDAMCRLLGRRAEEVRGQGVFDFFHGAQREVLERELALRRSGRSGSYEVDIVRPDGSRTPCLNHATPILDSAGKPFGSIGLWTDLSAVKHRERELATYALAVNSMADAVSVIDEQRNYLLVNDAWTKMTGVSRDDAIGRQTFAVLTPRIVHADRSKAIDSCIAQQTEVILRTSMALATAGNARRNVETRYQPFRDPQRGVQGVVMTTRDITDQEAARQTIETGAEYLRQTLNATGDGIFASDAHSPEEPVRFVNDQMLRLWNIPLDRAASLTPKDILDAAVPLMANATHELQRIQAIIASNRSDESRIQLKDGRVLFRRCEPASIGDRQLRVWSFRDITAEERALALLQNRGAEQQALLEAFPGFIARLDSALRFTYVGPRLARLLRAQPASLVGQSLALVFGRSLAMRHSDDAARALAGEPVVFEERFRTSQGRRWAQVTLAAGTDPVSGAPALYGFGIDITQRKRAEAQLSAARDEAQRANQAKTQFLSHMSHELRTPMNAIAGFSQLLLRDRHSPLSGDQREWVAQIRLGADHLLELINDILDLGRIEAGHLQVNNVGLALAPIIQECLSLTATLAQHRHIIWSVSDDLQNPDRGPRVVADRTRLKQVLLNLLSNAIKYNRERGQVSLAAEERDDRVIVSVSDTGAGLSADACARLFKPFERLDAESAGVEGTGIGLALCRHLVTAMGGDIGLESLPGHGSRFWISLPRARGDTQAARLSEAAALNSTAQRCEGMGRQVLYIDDSGVNVMLMEILLAEVEGLQLLTAQQPEDGLQLAQRHRPDLILLDIHMPHMDGFEVFRRLRTAATTAHIPVIAVSANALQTDIDKALSAGFADYLTKPIDLDQAMALVRRHLAPAAVESIN